MRELPRGWTTSTIGAICEKPQYGWTTKADHDADGLKLLRTTDITPGAIDWGQVPSCTVPPPDPEKYQLVSGDIVVSRAGSVGISIRVHNPPPAVFASYLIRLRPIVVDPAYLSWFLESPAYWRQIEMAAAGIALQNVNAKKLAAIELPVPPLAEQRRIVAAIEEQLSRLDSAVELLRQSKQRARVLRDAQIRRLIDETDWPLVPLSQTAELITDGDHNPPPRVTSGVPHLTAKNIRSGEIRVEGCTFVSLEGFEQTRRRYDPRPGDVIVTCVGTIGESAVVPEGLVFSADRNLAAVRPLPDFDANFLRFALSSERQRQVMLEASGSTAQPHLYLRDLRAMQLPAPPLEEQRAIASALAGDIAGVVRLDAAVTAAHRRAEALRRSVLAAAFRGDLLPQDPSDEPASVLLERIVAERAAAPKPSRRRRATMVER